MRQQTNQWLNSCQNVRFISIAVFVMFTPFCFGQGDSARTFKNTISINITNPMIFGEKYNTIGYERVIKDHQTASMSIGRFSFPKFIGLDTDSIGIHNEYKDKGFHISFDYRFFLKKENKFTAPRGVYLGPYYAYNHLNRELTWDLNTVNFTGQVKTNVNLSANLIGVQMGYQFVLWNRLAIDMVLLGPGMWFFKMVTDFNTTLAPDDEAMLIENINELLEESFPGSDLMITGTHFEAKKQTRSSSMGLRYLITLGFRF